MADAAGTTQAVGDLAKTGAKSAKGVPPYVWVIAVGGGLGVAYFMNRSKTNAATGTNTAAPSALVYTGSGQTTDTSADSSSSAAGGGFQTNDAWAQAAKNWLISQGSDAKEASDAVDLYINAQALNAKQNSMISAVTRGIGAPPQSLPPVTGTPVKDNTGDLSQFASAHVNYQDTTNPNASHLAGNVYTTKAGDTIDSIARKSYNFSNPTTAYSNLTYAMDEIINANFAKLPDVKNIPAGTQLYIPLLASQQFPNFGDKVPLIGFKPGAQATEWEYTAGIVPQTAAVPR